MQQIESSWVPEIGTSVRLKETGQVGTVTKVKGTRDRRFRLLVPAPASAGSVVAQKRARLEARIASRWYGLDELEPTP